MTEPDAARVNAVAEETATTAPSLAATTGGQPALAPPINYAALGGVSQPLATESVGAVGTTQPHRNAVVVEEKVHETAGVSLVPGGPVISSAAATSAPPAGSAASTAPIHASELVTPSASANGAVAQSPPTIAPTTADLPKSEAVVAPATDAAPAPAVEPAPPAAQAVSSNDAAPRPAVEAAPVQQPTAVVQEQPVVAKEPVIVAEPLPDATAVRAPTEPTVIVDNGAVQAVPPPVSKPIVPAAQSHFAEHPATETDTDHVLPLGQQVHPVHQAAALQDAPDSLVNAQIEKHKADKRQLYGEEPQGTVVPGLEDDKLWTMLRRFDAVRLRFPSSAFRFLR